jgi:hypothetical protein
MPNPTFAPFSILHFLVKICYCLNISDITCFYECWGPPSVSGIACE